MPDYLAGYHYLGFLLDEGGHVAPERIIDYIHQASERGEHRTAYSVMEYRTGARWMAQHALTLDRWRERLKPSQPTQPGGRKRTSAPVDQMGLTVFSRMTKAFAAIIHSEGSWTTQRDQKAKDLDLCEVIFLYIRDPKGSGGRRRLRPCIVDAGEYHGVYKLTCVDRWKGKKNKKGGGLSTCKWIIPEDTTR